VRTSAQLLASDELESRPAQLLTALTAKWLGAGTIYRDAATVYGMAQERPSTRAILRSAAQVTGCMGRTTDLTATYRIDWRLTPVEVPGYYMAGRY